MRFVWFWTFWYWSKESYRAGSILRSPLHGIGGHWDEWFRHEASEGDVRAIAEVGQTESNQRQFIAWLFHHWARETESRANRMIPRFVLGQLAQVPPFNRWPAFDEYRSEYGVAGIPAVVLSEDSAGNAEDIRSIEALALPADTAAKIVPEGFHADATELEAARRAAMSTLKGKGLLMFLALWIASGGRPYSRWLRIGLGAGWLAVVALFLYLLLGPDPGDLLPVLVAILGAVWSILVLFAIAVAAREGFHAWAAGRNLNSQLERSQIRMRMNGGLTIKGGSAGLPFCLNTLLSLHQADPRPARRSWIWQHLFRKLRSESELWAATGVVTADGYLKPVVLESKLRACLLHTRIRHLLTPNQRDANRRVIDRVAGALSQTGRENALSDVVLNPAKLGFAAEQRCLRSHRARHVAQALMALGGFTSRWQQAATVFALVASCAMLFALPNLKAILFPPPAPAAIAPSSPSPYHLWVSLDTKHPDYFYVVLQSDYWSNRRANVTAHSGANASPRAEIRLHRLARPVARNEEDGTVWIERRRRFLNREFAPGERVGCYSFSYLTRLGHE